MKAKGRQTVGVRELKASLSAYLRRVREGESLVVTDRGEPIARIVPASLPDGLARLVREGKVTPAERRPTFRLPTARLRGAKTAAELVIEDRQSRDDEIYYAAFPRLRPKSRK